MSKLTMTASQLEEFLEGGDLPDAIDNQLREIQKVLAGDLPDGVDDPTITISFVKE